MNIFWSCYTLIGVAAFAGMLDYFLKDVKKHNLSASGHFVYFTLAVLLVVATMAAAWPIPVGIAMFRWATK